MNAFWKDLGFKMKQFLQFVLAFASILFILFLIPKVNSFKYSYETGTPWQFDDLYSPFDFAILKSQGDYEKSKEDVLANHLRHYAKQDFENQSLSKAKLPAVGILFGTQFPSMGIFICKKVGF